MKRIEFDQVTTRGGDSGQSSSYSGERLYKDDILFEALGDLDELISHLGLARAAVREQASRGAPFHREEKTLDGIQRSLMTVGAVFATSPSSEQFAEIPKITEADIEKLETAEHTLLRSTEISQQFVVPGAPARGVPSVDVARSVTRRCERRIVRVIREKQRPDWEARLCQNYVNRLSDYLFVLARYCEQSS